MKVAGIVAAVFCALLMLFATNCERNNQLGKKLENLHPYCTCPPPMTDEEIKEQQREAIKARIQQMFPAGGIGD